MITETTGRDEILAMNRKYNEVLAWEAEFAQQVGELSNIDSEDTEAYKVAIQVIKAWEDSENIYGKKTNLARLSNIRKIERLEAKLLGLGYKFTKQPSIKHNGLWYAAITIEKVS